MKKLLIGLFLVFSIVGYGQKTKQQLKTLFDQIRNETATGANTNARVADAFQFLADASEPIIASSATTSGTSNYIADPGIASFTSYIKGQIFAIQFVNSNTGSSTINLAGKGGKNLKKPGGSTNLGAGDLVAGATYFIWYNGTSFEVLNLASSGGGGGESTFSADVTFVLSGSKSFGKYQNGQTAAWTGLTARQAILDAALEYINPSFNSFSVNVSTQLEKGAVISGSKTATWSIAVGSGTVSTIDVVDNTALTTLLTNTPNDGTQAFTATTRTLTSAGSTQSWKGVLHDTGGVTQDINSSNYISTGFYRMWWGSLASAWATSADVRATSNTQLYTGASYVDLVTGTTNNIFEISLPPGHAITNVTDLTNLSLDITSSYVAQTSINVLDVGGSNSDAMVIYKYNPPVPYSPSATHRISFN